MHPEPLVLRHTMKFRSALQLGILATAAFGTAASWLLLRRARGKGYYDKLPVYRLTNNAGMSVEISPLGASILKMWVHARDACLHAGLLLPDGVDVTNVAAPLFQHP